MVAVGKMDSSAVGCTDHDIHLVVVEVEIVYARRVPSMPGTVVGMRYRILDFVGYIRRRIPDSGRTEKNSMVGQSGG